MNDSEIWKNKDINDLPGEEWRDVVGYEGLYQVSSLGRVKSVDKMVTARNGGKRFADARILKYYVNKGGYLTVGLKDKPNRWVAMVHVLVATAFIPNSENKRTVNHIDGDKKNNCVSNLEWATHGENHFHAYDTGLRHHGELHVAAKIKNEDIPRIFEMRATGMAQWRIAEKIGVSRQQISKILLGQRRIRCIKELVK